EVLLVYNPDDKSMKAVKGINPDGSIDTTDPSKGADFMKIDRHSNALENFFTNYCRQTKEPTHLEFFTVNLNNVEKETQNLSTMIGETDNPDAAYELEANRIIPQDYAKEDEQIKEDVSVDAPKQEAQKSEYQPLDAEKIDWDQLEKMGIKREVIEKNGALEAMLNYRKSPTLIPIVFKAEDITIRTEARISLRTTDDGRIIPVVHAIQKAPQLDRPFYGHTFTNEEKMTLLQNRNLGHPIEIKIPNQEAPTKALVSIDPLTNDVVAVNLDKVRIPHELKGVQLSDEQRIALKNGEAVRVEKMTSKRGKHFSSNVQYNADRKGLEFKFDSPKESQAQTQGEKTEHAQATGSSDEPKELRIPAKLLGRDITEDEAAKLKAGEVVHMTGLTNKEGVKFEAYVRPNFERAKFDFYKWDPNKAQSQSQEQKQEQPKAEKQDQVEQKPKQRKIGM
ncbi:MAG: DUF3945 domain-containing protein, partial [Rikenellaceae bacterium]